ncbi:MMPL family transporter [Francisella sp. SYW-9]|uniref:MMPL family transporter n=1 Tax=Francisella sp. SYW-9 TaxID=2610888 RepID=UPI00123D1A95|nr:MMPL family transporter [Francisella sp. SYW-9]
MVNKYLIRLIIWSLIVLSSLFLFIVIITKGLNLNTNILALLPNQQTSPQLTAVSNKFSNRISNDVVFLISSKDQHEAIDSAAKFSKLLQQSNNFTSINAGVSENQQLSWAKFYFPYRLQLLSNKDKELLANKDYKRLYQNALANIYNPTGIVNRNLLNSDPFFTYQNYLFDLPKPSSNLKLKKGFLVAKKDNHYYVLIKAEIKGQSFSLTTQTEIIKSINNAIKQVSSNKVSVLKTGMLFYANAGAEDAHHEINTIDIGSIIGVLLLIILTFRSITPLFFTLLSISCGFIAAFVVTHYIFGSVFLFTLVFGASLIGISVDYAFFYYSEKLLADANWTPKIGLKRIFKGITLGLLNVVIAFLVISVAPFPGLHQLAIFGIVGLSVSYLTVICFFPYIINTKSKSHKNIPLLILTDKYLNICKNISTKKIIIILVVLCIITITGLYKIKPNDDIHILQSTPKKLKNEENQLKSIIGSDMGLSYIIVLAKNDNTLLTKADNVTNIIRENFTNIKNPLISISDYVPSIEQQKQNYNAIQKFVKTKYPREYLSQIGFSKAQQTEILNKIKTTKFKSLELSSWLNQPVSKQMRFLWLANQPNDYKALAITLSKDIDISKLQNLLSSTDDVYVIDKVTQISNIFGHYRNVISYIMVVVFMLLWLGLAIRYSIKKSLVYILVPLLSCLLSVAFLGLFNIPLTLFSILATILVLGISMDYVLFIAESNNRFSSTMLALSLSAITTILSFGLLALSNTPAIEYFGLTVLVGITVAFLLAPIAIKVQYYEK